MTKKIITVLLILLSCLVALCLAEWGARILLRSTGLEPMVPISVGRPDAELGWSLVPDTHAVSKWGNTPVSYSINENGLRDDPTPYTKPEGVFRIVLLGDSVSFGAGVPIEQHFSHLLEGYFQNVELVNLSVSGFGVDQELMQLRAEGFKYQPDLVLAYVDHYGNQRHMYGRIWGKEKPRFELQGKELVQVYQPDFAGEGIAGELQRLHFWLRRHLVLYQIIAEIHQRVAFPEETNANQDAAASQLMQDPDYVARMENLGAAIVLEMRKEAAANGADFLLMTRVNSLLQAMANQNMEVLNIEAPMENPDLTLPGDPHPNAAANGILAWELAQYLQQSELVPESHWIEK